MKKKKQKKKKKNKNKKVSLRKVYIHLPDDKILSVPRRTRYEFSLPQNHKSCKTILIISCKCY
jgi:hypothetical protein